MLLAMEKNYAVALETVETRSRRRRDSVFPQVHDEGA